MERPKAVPGSALALRFDTFHLFSFENYPDKKKSCPDRAAEKGENIEKDKD